MNNEPVAWMVEGYDGIGSYVRTVVSSKPKPDSWVNIIPLYTHPAKTLTDDPLVNFKPVWQEKPELTLTDEEIFKTAIENGAYQNKESGHIYPDDMYILNFARAILRKAQE
jgi:hypothetical protein